MFDKVVFAGGGHRCWWQAGFWDQVSGEIELHPRVIGGVSQGAVTACLLFAGDSKRALAWYERELKSVRSNFNWLNLGRRGRRLMPNPAIQRKALRALLGGESFRQLMWRAPEIRVQYARPPEGMSPARAVLGAMLARRADGPREGGSPATSGPYSGLAREVKRIQDCRSERELVDLLVAASSAPPFTAVEVLDGAPCIDGALLGELPTAAVADVPGQTLVLVTRHDKSLAPVFARGGIVYAQPSEKIAVSSWDYTSPAKYQKTYDLGRRDGEAFLKAFALGQHRDAAGLRLTTLTVPADGSAAVPGEPAAGVAGRSGEEAAAGDAAARQSAAAATTATAAIAMLAGDGKGVDMGTGMDEVIRTDGGPRSGEEERFDDAGGERDGATRKDADAHADAVADAAAYPPMRATDDEADDEGVLDVSAKLAAYREPTDAGIAEDLKASQPAASEGQARSGRSLRASNI